MRSTLKALEDPCDRVRSEFCMRTPLGRRCPGGSIPLPREQGRRGRAQRWQDSDSLSSWFSRKSLCRPILNSSCGNKTKNRKYHDNEDHDIGGDADRVAQRNLSEGG